MSANVAYFQRKIQLSVFSAYPDGWSSQLIRISAVLLNFQSAALNQTLLPASVSRTHNNQYLLSCRYVYASCFGKILVT